MSDHKPLTTPLHQWHTRNHATMGNFSGYSMPLWYASGAKHEHINTIVKAGLFDTSHMSILTLTGDSSFDLLQRTFSRDLRYCIGRPAAALHTGRAVYGMFFHEDGTVLDDAIITQLGENRYLLVVNAAMGGPVGRHLDEHRTSGCEIDEVTDEFGKIDLQGPAAGKILGSVLTDAGAVFAGLSYFSCRGTLFGGDGQEVRCRDGTELLVSRTGYTGEFGFELFMRRDALVSTWEQLLAAGESFSITACGLAARDSLRTGAGLPLSHQDIGAWDFGTTPWSFVLPYDAGMAQFSKTFVGGVAVYDNLAQNYTYGFAGYDPRKIAHLDKAAVLDEGDKKIGVVTSCTTDMAIDRVGDTIFSIASPVSAGRPEEFSPRGLSCGFIRVDKALSPGEVVVLVEGKRRLTVEIRTDIRPHRTARRSIEKMV
jgi:aminomethyltransferase